MDMTPTGSGGWLAGHVYASSGGAPRANHAVLAFRRDTIVGSCISEDNRINEGFPDADPGFFLMAVRAGTIDSISVYGRTSYRTPSSHYTQIAPAWTVAAGDTTWVDASAIIENVTRSPQYPIAAENVLISARISKTGGSIQRDSIRYAVNDTTTWLRATHDSVRLSDSTYFFHIPPADTGAVVFWRLVAYDEMSSITVSTLLSYRLPLDHSIYQIQYRDTLTGQTTPDSGKYVHTAGIVTGILTQAKFYIGVRAGGAWRGLHIYRRGTITDTVRVGDSLDVVGGITEYFRLSQVDTLYRLIHNGIGLSFDTTRMSLRQSKQEAFECVLVRTDTIRMIDGVGGTFVRDNTYRLTNYAGTDTAPLYVTGGSQFEGTPVPSGWCRLIANVSDHNGRELTPRVPADISLLPPDVSVSAILAPLDSLIAGDTVSPQAVVRNAGGLNSAASIPVTFRIGTIYNVQQTVGPLAPGQSDTVVFSLWTAVAGTHELLAFTLLAGDPVPGNDTLRGSVFVQTRDVGATSIVRPPAGVSVGTVVQPSIRVRNYGTSTATFDLRLVIESGGTPVYDTTETGVVLASRTTVDHVFTKTWTASPEGTYDVAAWTLMAGDSDPFNDTCRGTCSVISGPVVAWTSRTMLPGLPSSKPVSDGGWLVEKDDFIYAAKGNKTGDFYRYDPPGDSWHALASIPRGTDGKMPGKGATGIHGDEDNIYATKGNNTRSFFRYDLGKDSWYQLADVPLGLYNKKVKGGTDIAYVKGTGPDVGRIYLLKGYKNEYYKYDIVRDSWHAMPDAPTGANVKWDRGSWLAYHGIPGQGEHTIYAHKAKYHDFYKFDAAADTWYTAKLTGMPFLSRTGKSRKSKDGGSAAWLSDAIYAFKGANTQELWRYLADGDSWTEMETIPAIGPSGKKKRIKGGADLVAYENVLYAFKGNKCNELWLYTPGVFAGSPLVARGGVSGGTVPGSRASEFTITPNPLTSGIATVRFSSSSLLLHPSSLSLFDPSGRLVLQSAICNLKSEIALNLRGLSAGIYLVRLSANGFTATQKLVVQQ